MRGSLRLRGRHGTNRPFVDQVAGADFWRKAERWAHKVRRIDRDANQYDEVVTDPETGSVVHECHEPLSRHQGHGGDKGVADFDDGGPSLDR